MKRRDFLKKFGLGVSAVGVIRAPAYAFPEDVAVDPPSDTARIRWYYDLSSQGIRLVHGEPVLLRDGFIDQEPIKYLLERLHRHSDLKRGNLDKVWMPKGVRYVTDDERYQSRHPWECESFLEYDRLEKMQREGTYETFKEHAYLWMSWWEVPPSSTNSMLPVVSELKRELSIPIDLRECIDGPCKGDYVNTRETAERVLVFDKWIYEKCEEMVGDRGGLKFIREGK